LAGILYS